MRVWVALWKVARCHASVSSLSVLVEWKQSTGNAFRSYANGCKFHVAPLNIMICPTAKNNYTVHEVSNGREVKKNIAMHSMEIKERLYKHRRDHRSCEKIDKEISIPCDKIITCYNKIR